MAKLQLSFVAAALLVVSTQAIVKDKCSWAVGKYPFDEEKMAGTWYVVASAGNSPNDDAHFCAKYEVGYLQSNEGKSFQVKYSALDKERQEISFEGVSKPYKRDRTSMFLGVMKKPGTDKYQGVYKQAIIATDYENYAAFLACRPTFDPFSKDFGRIYKATVLSRKHTLDEGVKDTLMNVLSGYDIHMSKFRHIEHKECRH